MRRRFTGIFDDLLKSQLILKGVIQEGEWPEIKEDLMYKFASDAYYTESKDQEVMRSRLEILNSVAPFVGQMFSKEYVQKNILRFSDDEIALIDSQLAASTPQDNDIGDNNE